MSDAMTRKLIDEMRKLRASIEGLGLILTAELTPEPDAQDEPRPTYMDGTPVADA
ncbi:MAG: hypothetical protein WKF61_04810 [Luteimonas sp.]